MDPSKPAKVVREALEATAEKAADFVTADVPGASSSEAIGDNGEDVFAQLQQLMPAHRVWSRFPADVAVA